MITVGALLDHLDTAVPFAWAAPWDRVGLLAGDREAGIERVLVSLDPTHAALDRAAEAGAGVLLTHHPAFLDAQEAFTPGTGGAGVAFEAVRRGIALIACHTNLDRAPRGADALARRLGLDIEAPLERATQDMILVTSYAPAASADGLVAAMAGAGAGRMGAYDECAFMSSGTGRFHALRDARPALGAPGESTSADETRIEMVCPPAAFGRVVMAARMAHPYEEPVVFGQAVRLSLGVARSGRICRAPEHATARSLATLVAERLGVMPTVWGEGSRAVSRVALAPGSGRSVVGDALAAGADAFVTGELRYHEAQDAAAAGLVVIEAGHDATEWPLTGTLAEIAAEMPALGAQGVIMDRADIPWWIAERP